MSQTNSSLAHEKLVAIILMTVAYLALANLLGACSPEGDSSIEMKEDGRFTKFPVTSSKYGLLDTRTGDLWYLDKGDGWVKIAESPLLDAKD
jgi:hypothetical protein